MSTRFKSIQQRVQVIFEEKDSSARFWALATLFCLLFVWWRSMLWYRSQLLAEQRLQAQAEVSLQGNALSEAINRRFSLLRGLHAFVLTENSQANFDKRISLFSANLYKTTSGIRNILVAPGGTVTHIYPLQGNEDLIGFDLLHTLQPELQEDVQLAIETEEIILGFPLDYAQSGWGLAARQAVFLEDGRFWGLIGIVVDMPTLLADAGLYSESPSLEYTLLDNSGQVVFESSPAHGATGISYSLGLPQEETWELIGHPKDDWGTDIRGDLLPIQISGLVIILLLSGQVYISINRQKRLAFAVQERTHEIAQINRTLEQRVAARTRELTTMLEVSQNVASMPDVQPLLSLILSRLQEIAPCIAVAIFLREGQDALTLLSYQGPLARSDMPGRWSLAMADHFRTILQTRIPVIIPDVRADITLARAWRETTQAHLGILPDYVVSWMGVPLIVKNRVTGLLVLHHQAADFFTHEQASLALAFAHQAALAIENARLYEDAQQAAVLRERQRLARELHDSVSQALYSIGLGARTAQSLANRTLAGETKSRLLEPIQHILTMAEAGLAEMRALIFELKPESLQVEGLNVTLTRQTSAIQARHGLDVRVHLCEEPEISLDLKLLIYRIVQEALHNVVKHAQARGIDLDLDYQPGHIDLTIRDDGRGFDIQAGSPGLGLRSMRERVEQVQGAFEIASIPGSGTTIKVHIPLST